MKYSPERKQNWINEKVKPLLKKKPERNKQFKNTSGMDIERLYTPDQIAELDYHTTSGFPGDFPFTRGIQPTMYRGRFWTMRQYAGFGSAEDTNKRYRYLLQQGQTGLSVAFDLPTQIGYDPDDLISYGEVGKVGVSISSIKDMEVLFKDIPLDKVSTSMTINATSAILLAMYQEVAEKQGVDISFLRGTIQNDILKEYIARGTYIYPPEPSLRIITDIFEYCQENLPNFNTISISGYHIREAGSTAVQELAFTLANGITYVKAALDKGLHVDTFAQRLSFFFNVHNNFFEEIAKFRAARRLWADIMKNRFYATTDKAMQLRFHTQTAGSTLSAQEPDNNIIRVTLQALSAVLGGTQSLHTNSKDEALALPSEASVKIALRTQQIIAHESAVGDTIDPFGGSYFIEKLTDEIYTAAKKEIEKIDKMGGMIKAIEQGYVQKQIENSAYETQKKIEKKEQIIVAVNKFTSKQADSNSNLLKIDPDLQRKRIEQIRDFKEKRNVNHVKRSLQHLKKVALTKDNIMFPIRDAVKNFATLGEISNALRDVFGEF